MNRLKAASAVVGLIIIPVLVASGSRPNTAWLERSYYVSQVLLLAITAMAAAFVYLQIAQIRETLKRGDFDSTSNRIYKISELLLEHPQEYSELRENRAGLRAGVLAEAILDVIDTELLRRRSMSGALGHDIPSLNLYFRDLLMETPGLRKVLAERKEWYSPELQALAWSSPEQSPHE